MASPTARGSLAKLSCGLVLLLLFSSAIALPQQQQQQESLSRGPPPWTLPGPHTWWQRLGIWWRRWVLPPDPLRKVVLTPRGSNGKPASPVELLLPSSQIEREQRLAQLPAAANVAWPHPHWPPWPKKRSQPWTKFNSSRATPLVPHAYAWMVDSHKMALRADNSSLDIDVARALSRLVAASYCNVSNLPRWRCGRCAPNFKPQRVIFDPLWDLLGFVGWSDELDAIVVAFRGTDSHSYYNWVENMRTWRTDMKLSIAGIPKGALVHGGFFHSYNGSYLAANVSAAVKELVMERTAHPSGAGGGGRGGDWAAHSLRAERSAEGAAAAAAPTVFVSGHSLGAALATLAALDLKVSLNLPDVRLVSFGSPRVGNWIFSRWFSTEIAPHWRFTHNRDIVPSVPPGYMGFSHVPQEVWVVDFLSGRTLVGICDGTGEDPRCHNSMCHVGLCSSVSDHLLYLSEMYSPHPRGC